MKIVIISGSIRSGRRTHKLAEFLTKRLNAEPDIAAELIDLQEYELPMFHHRWEHQDPPPDNLAQVGKLLMEADAMLLVSPEYHGSYTGVLKNAIDHYWKEFARKPIGVATTSTGQHGGINGSIQMQHLILSLGAFPLPQKLLVPDIGAQFDEHGKATAFVRQRIEKFLEPFLWFSRALFQAKQ
jgi:azobenzene reductase